MQKLGETKVRKLPLPLEIKVGDDTMVTDGLFNLTSKEASKIRIISVDQDGYVTCEITPSQQIRSAPRSLTEIFSADTLIGTEMSKMRGRGKDFGQYKYFRRPNGSFYAEISGARTRRLQLGSLNDKRSPIARVARTIVPAFNSNEFSKKQLVPLLAKNLSYGQILKSILDILKIEGYLEKREIKPRGRLKELFKATNKLKIEMVAIPEQA